MWLANGERFAGFSEPQMCRTTEKSRLLSDVELAELKADMERASRRMRQELAGRRRSQNSVDLNIPRHHGPR